MCHLPAAVPAIYLPETLGSNFRAPGQLQTPLPQCPKAIGLKDRSVWRISQGVFEIMESDSHSGLLESGSAKNVVNERRVTVRKKKKRRES